MTLNLLYNLKLHDHEILEDSKNLATKMLAMFGLFIYWAM